MTMFDYRSDQRKIATDMFLCYDDTAKGDLAVRFILLKDGEEMVILFREADKPFDRGSVQERISPEHFATRTINGRALIDLIRAQGEDPVSFRF